MNKGFWAVLLVIVGVFGFIYVNSEGSKTSTLTAKYSNGNYGEVKAEDHKVGAGNKKVTLIEYGDFECPACGNYYPTLKAIKAKYGDDITFVFRHLPIDGSHPNARAAHRAAEAAGKQGKFWEMHDRLYENQQSWSTRVTRSPQTFFEGYAREIGLDMTKYKADVASSEVNSIILTDEDSAKQFNAKSTPTFILNGRKIENPKINTIGDIEAFSAVIDAEIAKLNPQSPAPDAAPAGQ